jgi:actin-related protein 10
LSPAAIFSEMPFYEGIGLIAEKNAVVLDLGASYTKVGYAGEAAPRAILPTPLEVALHMGSGPASLKEPLYDALVPFVHTLYFKHLLVNPKDRRVVLLDALLGPIKVKEVLSEVLFKHFEVLSVLYAPSHLMPLFTLGVNTGLVLDVGHSEATVVPVYEGVPILKAWQAQPMASEAVDKEVVKMLHTRGTVKTVHDEVSKVGEVPQVSEMLRDLAEDIKVRLCFVTNLKRGRQIQKIRGDASSVSGLSSFLKKAVPTATYPVPGGEHILHVDGSVRESACEVMFEQVKSNSLFNCIHPSS